MPPAQATMSLRERNKLRTRAELLAAALAVFNEDGFADSSVDKVAKAAGTAKGTVYSYFPDGLNEIYREIYVDLSDKLLKRAIEARSAEADPARRIVVLAEALFDLAAEPAHGRFYALISPLLGTVLAPVTGRASRVYAAMIAEDLATWRGTVEVSTDDLAAADLLVGATREALRLISETPDRRPALTKGFQALVEGLGRNENTRENL